MTLSCLLAALFPALAALGAGTPPTRHELAPVAVPAPRPERLVPSSPEQSPARAAPKPEIRAGMGPLPAEDGRVRIIVRVIAAEPGVGGKDPRLSTLEANLDTLPLRYGTLKLVEEKTFDLAWKTGAEMQLPGSRSMLVTPRQLGADGRIRVHLEVLGVHPEHSRSLHTDYSVARGGTLLVGGYRLDPAKPESGVLLIAITQVLQR